ncbi:MAG TPA: histidine kinase, partial [Ktedonobacteraceae bacterium]|nr:histidine kinase [Ktedonobacteraceae bacterium]
LTCASQSAHLQQRMINDLIDHARVRTNQLALSMAPCDLLALTKEVVVEQQRSVPERTIVLETLPAEPAVPLIADARR